jgi:phage baseplate assembly protein W
MRSSDTLIPHIAIPFRFVNQNPGAGVEMNEQDTLDDIYDCVQAICRCTYGFRPELREFGIHDQTFSESDEIDLNLLEVQVSRWEPRASILYEQAPDLLDRLNDIVKLRVATQGGPNRA